MKFYVHGVNGLAVEADPLTWAQHVDIAEVSLDICDTCRYIGAMSDDITTPLRIPRDMAELIETYWHLKKLPSRSAAIRELLAYALDAKLAKPAKEQRR